ncbi:DUF7426 family protein [Enterococcus hirae]|uniref:DUF7426 family protein n=1 Tax=Enterococcus hirae TaxID=1354 RepID=UPI00136B0F56|nr:hypothetical protein [Enterococcus hirae]NAE18082.1 hypothetical protein [Enterococcus hirae]
MSSTPEEEFGDLADLLTIEPKPLTINGVVYDFPGDVSAQAWLVIQHTLQTGVAAKIAANAGKPYTPKAIVLDDDAELDLRAELFGDCAQEMTDNNVSSAYQQHAMTTLMVWHVYGREAALKIWRGTTLGEAAPPNRAARRSSGAGTTTKTPASTSGTRSRSTTSSRTTRTR